MKIFVILFILAFALPCQAADVSPININNATDTEKPDELSSPYYTIQMPDGWKVVMPPTEKHGNTNAIFSTNDGKCVVTLIMGPTLGEGAAGIAKMFADEFKATAKPALKNGKYVFPFPQNQSTAQAQVTVQKDTFRLVTVFGDQKTAQKFIDSAILPPKAETSPEQKKTGDEVKKEKDEPQKPKAAEDKKETASEDKKTTAKEDKKTTSTEDKKEAAPEKPKPGVYFCKFYSVQLPEGWQAVLPPEEQQGNVNAIFADPANNTVIAIVVGPTLGADGNTVASMFADQFKATSKISENDGQYSFDFVQNEIPTQAYVTTQNQEFMLLTAKGNRRDINNFLTQIIKSDDYSGLIPKI